MLIILLSLWLPLVLKYSHLGNKLYILKNIPERQFTMENCVVLKSNTLFSNLIK